MNLLLKFLITTGLLLVPVIGHVVQVGTCDDIESAITSLQELQNLTPSSDGRQNLSQLKHKFNDHMSDFQMYRGIDEAKVRYLQAMRVREDANPEVLEKRVKANQALNAIEHLLKNLLSNSSDALNGTNGNDISFDSLLALCTDEKCKSGMSSNKDSIENLIAHWARGNSDDNANRKKLLLEHFKNILPSHAKRDELISALTKNSTNLNEIQRVEIDKELLQEMITGLEKEFGASIRPKLAALWERDKLLEKLPPNHIPQTWEDFQKDVKDNFCKGPSNVTFEDCIAFIFDDGNTSNKIETEREKLNKIQTEINNIKMYNKNYKLLSDMIKTLAERSIAKKCGTDRKVILGECYTQTDALPINVDATLTSLAGKDGKIIAEIDVAADANEDKFIHLCSQKIGSTEMVKIVPMVCANIIPYKQGKRAAAAEERDHKNKMRQINGEIICNSSQASRVTRCRKPAGVWNMIGKTALKKTLSDPQFLTVGIQTLSASSNLKPYENQGIWQRQYQHDLNDWEQNIFFPNYATYYRHQINPWYWNYNSMYSSVNTTSGTNTGSYYSF